MAKQRNNMQGIYQKLKIKILSRLLFHANRETKDARFYEIKNRLLSKFGQPIGFDLQIIDGKICFHCDGSGECNHPFECCFCSCARHYNGNESCDCWDKECSKCCGDGYWKNPQKNLLLKVRFGRYVFHQPVERLDFDSVPPQMIDNEIKGYIEHEKSPCGKYALSVLYAIFRRSPQQTAEQKSFW